MGEKGGGEDLMLGCKLSRILIKSKRSPEKPFGKHAAMGIIHTLELQSYSYREQIGYCIIWQTHWPQPEHYQAPG